MSSFSAESLVNKTGIVTSVAKSDEIGKIAHLVWCKISRELLNQAFLSKKSVLARGAVIYHGGLRKVPVSQQKVWLTEQVSLRVLLKVTKSVKSHISFGVRVQEIL